MMARGDSLKVIPSSAHSYGYPGIHIYGKPFFLHILVLSVIATLIISIFSLVNVYQLKKIAIPKTVDAGDFLKKLTAHGEMKGYVGVAPLNIIQVNGNNLANLQAQINGLDVSYLGKFIVQYTDRIIVYDYDNDKLIGTVSLQQPQQPQLPTDFFTKLNKHTELQGLQNQEPIGGQIDKSSLSTLKQQFPEVYANAKVGDFLLRYKTRLVIYDYNKDLVVNAVNLG